VVANAQHCLDFNLMLVPARAGDNNSESRSHVSDDDGLQWCFSRFPAGSEAIGASSRPLEDLELAPLNLDEMIAPADLITKTEVVGGLPGYIRKYRGVWIGPTTGSARTRGKN
jgi:hypothetical protein